MASPQAQGMEDILKKLQNAQDNADHIQEERSSGNIVVAKNSQEMFNILSKLEEATTAASKKVIQESKTDPVLATGSIKENRVTVGAFNVIMEKQTVIKGVSKTFYHIEEDNERIYSDIALYESAMGIVKGMLFNDKNVSRIVELDSRYSSALQEAAHYKMKSKRLTESFDFDIAQAKQRQASQKMSKLKSLIKSLL